MQVLQDVLLPGLIALSQAFHMPNQTSVPNQTTAPNQTTDTNQTIAPNQNSAPDQTSAPDQISEPNQPQTNFVSHVETENAIIQKLKIIIDRVLNV